jgi:hypothetical protein
VLRLFALGDAWRAILTSRSPSGKPHQLIWIATDQKRSRKRKRAGCKARFRSDAYR